MFSEPLDAPPVDGRVRAHEVVGQRLCFLAEKVNFVAPAHEGAAEVLDVDVAARAGEHVPVRHKKPHGGQNTRAA